MAGTTAGDGDLSGVLRRLTDPLTSTRRTPVARARLANDDVTRELLDAGLRLLDAEFGSAAPQDPGAGAPRSRFFGFLSAARVTAEASDGGAPATAARLRDRWPLMADYVEDLLAFALSQHQWAGHLAGSAALVGALGPAADAGAAVREVAALNVFGAELTVVHRLRLVAAPLARPRPQLRAALARSYDHLDATWAALEAHLLAHLGLRLRAGVTQLELTRAVMALADGVNLRVAALGDDGGADPRSGAALLTAGALALVRSCCEPGAPTAEDPPVPPLPARPEEADLSGVLRRLTDPGTGARRTARARARLANDATTRQLLDAGLRLLDAEFRPDRAEAADGRREPSRFFDFLSASRVSAEVRSAGYLLATPAHLRDRWPRHDDFVDDLIAYAVSPQQGTFGPAAVQRAADALAAASDLAAVAREVTHDLLVEAERTASAGLRLVAATLAEGRPAVRAAMRETYARREGEWAAFYEQLLARCGLRLRDDVPMPLLTRLLMALTEGMVVRFLAVGEEGLLDRRSHDSLFARTSVLLVRGCTEPAD